MGDFMDNLTGTLTSVLRDVEEKRFETDGTAAVTLVGFSAEEIASILSTYREHVSLMMAAARDAQSGADSVRYVPHHSSTDL